MAIVQNPLISRASGSVGNSIFSKWKNKNTLRSKSINPYPAASPAQLVNQQKMKDLINLYSLLKPYRTLFYSKKNSKYSYLSFLVKQNMMAFVGDVNVVESHLVPSMSFSATILPPLSYATAFDVIGNRVSIIYGYFTDPINLGLIAGVYIISFNRNSRQFILTFVQTNSEYVVFDVPNAAPSDTVDIFLCTFYESPAACSPFSFVLTTN